MNFKKYNGKIFGVQLNKNEQRALDQDRLGQFGGFFCKLFQRGRKANLGNNEIRNFTDPVGPGRAEAGVAERQIHRFQAG